jgi:hypothetical protein
MRRKTLAALLMAPLLGCDPNYSLHLHARVTRGGAPAAGAWALALQSARTQTALSAPSDSNGVIEATFQAFLSNPSTEPLIFGVGPNELQILIPDRDFKTHSRGFFYVTEWDADVSLELKPQLPTMKLDCTETTCTVVVPSRYCSLHEVNVSTGRAESLLVAVLPLEAGQAFTFPRRSPSLAAVAICLEDNDQWSTWVSNAIEASGPREVGAR